jgi:hypothetical protein
VAMNRRSRTACYYGMVPNAEYNAHTNRRPISANKAISPSNDPTRTSSQRRLESNHLMPSTSFFVVVTACSEKMPLACPVEFHAGCYKTPARKNFTSPPDFPAAAYGSGGEIGIRMKEGRGTSISSQRQQPPGKPAAWHTPCFGETNVNQDPTAFIRHSAYARPSCPPTAGAGNCTLYGSPPRTHRRCYLAHL